VNSFTELCGGEGACEGVLGSRESKASKGSSSSFLKKDMQSLLFCDFKQVSFWSHWKKEMLQGQKTKLHYKFLMGFMANNLLPASWSCWQYSNSDPFFKSKY
jgi:hypothetical protein